jgi:hypothetical protein
MTKKLLELAVRGGAMLRDIGVVLQLAFVIATAGCGGGSVTRETHSLAGRTLLLTPRLPPVSPPFPPPRPYVPRAGDNSAAGTAARVNSTLLGGWKKVRQPVPSLRKAFTRHPARRNFHVIATSSHNTNLSATAPLTIVGLSYSAARWDRAGGRRIYTYFRWRCPARMVHDGYR